MILMFPIVIRAGKGFIGSEEWGTRFVEEIALRKKDFNIIKGGELLDKGLLGAFFSSL